MNNRMDHPLSQSSVSLRLSEIQKRCSELLDGPEELLELRLEEPVPTADSGEIYHR